MADEEVGANTRNQPQNVIPNETNVSSLLFTWGLSDLQSKFKSHQIESRALFCLTEKDICELIPKIGRRAIFRSNLREWRRKNINNIRRRDVQQPQPAIRIATRVETEAQNEETSNNIPVVNTVIKDEQMHSDYESEEISENMQNHDDDMGCEEIESDGASMGGPISVMPDGKKFNVVVPSKRHSSNCHVDVSEILSNNPEGQQIIAYYEVNGSFDYSHRRRLVTLLINEVIRKNRWLVQDDFAKISQEIIHLFPREDVTTYYTARNGLKNPKGCLYNKFLNLTRKLRQEGILQYRNNVQIMPERISARHSGEIKCYAENY